MQESTTASIQTQAYPLEFRGQGKEYFKIWIVNIGLTILTLGIYSAWAKVRTRRYFYNHTYLNGQTFDYHAEPLKILKGRLMIGGVVLCFSLSQFSAWFLLIPVIFYFMLPYFLVRGAIFNFVNTSHRGVRFGFERNYKGSYKTMLKALLVTVFTLGIGIPATYYYWKRFIADHLALGKLRFKMGGDGRSFWGAVMKEPFIYGLSYGVLIVVISFVLGALGLMGEGAEMAPYFGFAFMFLGYLFYGFVFVIYQVRSSEYYANHLVADGGVRFKSNLTLWDTLLMYLEQAFLLVITLGLAWPWVQVAIKKFKFEHFAVLTTPEFFNTLEQSKVDNAEAFGEEVASFWDFDIGF